MLDWFGRLKQPTYNKSAGRCSPLGFFVCNQPVTFVFLLHGQHCTTCLIGSVGTSKPTTRVNSWSSRSVCTFLYTNYQRKHIITFMSSEYDDSFTIRINKKFGSPFCRFFIYFFSHRSSHKIFSAMLVRRCNTCLHEQCAFGLMCSC